MGPKEITLKNLAEVLDDFLGFACLMLGKRSKHIHQMMVVHGVESHGWIRKESPAKTHPSNPWMVDIYDNLVGKMYQFPIGSYGSIGRHFLNELVGGHHLKGTTVSFMGNVVNNFLYQLTDPKPSSNCRLWMNFGHCFCRPDDLNYLRSRDTAAHLVVIFLGSMRQQPDTLGKMTLLTGCLSTYLPRL